MGKTTNKEKEGPALHTLTGAANKAQQAVGGAPREGERNTCEKTQEFRRYGLPIRVWHDEKGKQSCVTLEPRTSVSRIKETAKTRKRKHAFPCGN